MLGYRPGSVEVTGEFPSAVHIGEKLPVVVTLVGQGPVLVDLRVHFVKANGTTSAKVFRGGEFEVDGRATLRRTISFAHHSTRRPYPGPHRIEALVNGVPHTLGTVEVVE